MVKPGYKQTEIGVIPEDWEVNSIRSVVTSYRTGGNYRNSSEVTEAPLIKMGNLSRGYINLQKIEYVSRGVVPNPLDRLQYGDVLFNTRNTPELVGKTAAWKNELPCAYYNLNLLRFEFDPDRIDPFFFNAILNTKDLIAELKNIAKGTTSVAAIYPQDLMNVKIQIPPISEQRMISKAITEMDDLIELLEKQIAKKQTIKQGAMQELLTGKKRLPGFSGEWINFNLMKHSKIKARIGWQGLKKSEYLDSGYALLITGTDFDDGKVEWDSCHYVTRSRYEQDRNIQIQNNDILITKDGSLGKAALVQGLTKPATLNSGIFVIRPMQNAYDPVFVYHILSSFVFKDFLDKLSAGSTIIHLYQKDICKFEFLLPPTIEEQEAIAALLSEMDSEIEALQQKLEKYRQLKQGIMQQLLTGKIRLK